MPSTSRQRTSWHCFQIEAASASEYFSNSEPMNRDTISRSNVEDVKFVINLDYPSNSEDYVHRIGRTGRSQRTGTAYAFFTPSNAHKAGDLIQVLEEAKQVVNPKLYELSRNPSLFKRGRFGGRSGGGGAGGGGGNNSRGNNNRGGGSRGNNRGGGRDSGDRGGRFDRGNGGDRGGNKWSGNNSGGGMSGSNYNKPFSSNNYGGGGNSNSNSYSQNGNSYGNSGSYSQRNGY